LSLEKCAQSCMVLSQDCLFTPSSILSSDRDTVWFTRLRKPWIRVWDHLDFYNQPRFVPTTSWPPQFSYLSKGVETEHRLDTKRYVVPCVGSTPNHNEYDMQNDKNTSAEIGYTLQCPCRTVTTLICMRPNHVLMSAILVIWKDTVTAYGEGIWTFCVWQSSHHVCPSWLSRRQRSNPILLTWRRYTFLREHPEPLF